MPQRKANAVWNGTLKNGSGSMSYGTYTGNFSFTSRFESGEGTNPEELIAAAHAGCFSMAFSLGLETAGFPANKIETEANLIFEKIEEGWRITSITLKTNCDIPNIDEKQFLELAESAKKGCPISNALSDKIQINLEAKLI
ncbi:MAG: OsmC family peroxiredoxin [Candidatus Hodarchaeales archaeon]|jgi:osmotically inducible protein OsmC